MDGLNCGQTLTLEGQTIALTELRSLLTAPNQLNETINQFAARKQFDRTLSDNARNTLLFCTQWLSGTDAYTIKTSGSTGRPKPITILRQQMEASAKATGKALGLRAGQHALVCLPTRYIAGRMILVRGFVLGLNMTVVEPTSDPFVQTSTDAEFDFTALVPLQLQTLLDSESTVHARLNRMKAILMGGGPVSAALEARLQSLTVPIYHTFGMTETVTHIALRRLNGQARSNAFTPLPDVQLDVDERGCLNIRSVVTLDQLIQTNDRVILHEDGTFVWLGRCDSVINSGGIKVQVEKVEKALEQAMLQLELPERRMFVGPIPDERFGETVSLIVESLPFSSEEENAINSCLKESLDAYEIPRRFVHLPRFAETPTRKIDRQKNLALIRDG